MIICRNCGSHTHSTGSPFCSHKHKADPELERLLAEEEEIEANIQFGIAPNTVSNVGQLRQMLAPFSDEMKLHDSVQVIAHLDLDSGSTLEFRRRSDG